jgi:hypothetical protein
VVGDDVGRGEASRVVGGAGGGGAGAGGATVVGALVVAGAAVVDGAVDDVLVGRRSIDGLAASVTGRLSDAGSAAAASGPGSPPPPSWAAPMATAQATSAKTASRGAFPQRDRAGGWRHCCTPSYHSSRSTLR